MTISSAPFLCLTYELFPLAPYVRAEGVILVTLLLAGLHRSLGTQLCSDQSLGEGVWPAPTLCLAGEERAGEGLACVYCFCSNAGAPVPRAELFFARGLRQRNKINVGGKVSCWVFCLFGFFWLLKLKAAVFFSKVGMTASSAD